MLLERLEGVSHGIRLCTTGTAATKAIQQLDLNRVAILAPSWFDEQLCELGAQYFSDQGINVVYSAPSGPEGGPLAITAETMGPALEVVAAETDPDAIFVAGNGQRAIGAIAHGEEKLGVTILTANQVLLWAALEGSGLRERIAGYGRLFSEGD